MRKVILLLLSLVVAISLPTSVKAAPRQIEQPVVNAVLFYTNGCPHCNLVLTKTLPPLQDRFRSQLNILLVEVSTAQDVDSLYALGGALGLAKEQVAVPFLLIDRIALIGVDVIGQRLPELIQKYLSNGGLEYPDIPLLTGMLAKGIPFSSYDPHLQLVPPAQAGMATSDQVLAWAVMIFMILAVLLVIIMIIRAFRGSVMAPLKGWLDITIPVLAVIGIGVAIYLTYIEITHARALCGPVGDCNAVQNSSYAKLFGFLPVGLVGALGYMAILITWLWRRYRSDAFANIAGPVLFGMALFGTLFSIYLTYIELYVIHAVCIWCLSSAVIIALLMLLGLPYVTQWLAIPEEEDQPVE